MQNKSKKEPKGSFRVRVGPSFRKVTSLLFACDINRIADHYTQIANTFLVNNGPKWTCTRLKGYYNIGCKIALQLDTEIIPFCRISGSSKGKVPRDMIPFLPYLKSPDLNKRRACLTVLRAYTQIFCQVSTDTVSIELPGPSEELFLDYEVHFHNVCMKYKSFTKPYLRDEGLYTTSKAGPNGRAMLDVDKDYAAIKDSQLLVDIKELNKEVESICEVPSKREVSLSAGFAPDFDEVSEEDTIAHLPRSKRKQVLYTCMENFNKWRLKIEPNAYNKVRQSKISFLAEGGCKTRVIAIGDYFSQDALKPLHKSLYRVLNTLQTDGTSSHNRISQVVRERTGQRSVVRSYDLTTATDRFPIFIQEKVLACMYTPRIASLWRSIMTNRPFYVDENKDVRYAYGQPMGLLSSWAAFALTHHIIVETCASIVGLNSFKDYVIIGDDVTIFNPKVADEYEKFLHTFGIQISEAKSLKSEGNPSSAEIAKRLFINGNEVSPVPFDAIESSIRDFLLFPNLVRLCLERGVTRVTTDPEPVQGALASIYGSRTADKVITLLSCPISGLPFGITLSNWEETPEVIREVFNELQMELIANKARSLYENELQNIPAMGILGVALESDMAPDDLSSHPLFVLLRAYRDRCGSIHQGITIKGFSSEDVSLIPFLINPMIPNYIRRTHRLERTRSTLILKTYQKIREKITSEQAS